MVLDKNESKLIDPKLILDYDELNHYWKIEVCGLKQIRNMY